MKKVIALTIAVFMLTFGLPLFSGMVSMGTTYAGDECQENETPEPTEPAVDVVDDTGIGNLPVGCSDWEIATYGFRSCPERPVRVFVNGQGFVPSSFVK